MRCTSQVPSWAPPLSSLPCSLLRCRLGLVLGLRDSVPLEEVVGLELECRFLGLVHLDVSVGLSVSVDGLDCVQDDGVLRCLSLLYDLFDDRTLGGGRLARVVDDEVDLRPLEQRVLCLLGYKLKTPSDKGPWKI